MIGETTDFDIGASSVVTKRIACDGAATQQHESFRDGFGPWHRQASFAKRIPVTRSGTSGRRGHRSCDHGVRRKVRSWTTFRVPESRAPRRLRRPAQTWTRDPHLPYQWNSVRTRREALNKGARGGAHPALVRRGRGPGPDRGADRSRTATLRGQSKPPLLPAQIRPRETRTR